MSDIDVLVMGAGAAGLSAAIEATDAGAEVLVLESGNMGQILTSSSGLGGKLFAFAGTDLQKENGIDDSPEVLYNDLITLGEGYNDSRLVRAYVENELDTYHWLIGLGAKFPRLRGASGMSRIRGHVIAEPSVNVLLRACELRNIRLRFNKRGQRLVNDGGRVTGITCSDGETVKASTVIVASGGYTHNKTLLREYTPHLADPNRIPSVACKRHLGDGLLMGMEVGASITNMIWVAPTYGLGFAYEENQPEKIASQTYKVTSLAFYSGGIIVNSLGRRFVNESWPYKDIGLEALKQPNAISYIIFDSRVRDSLNVIEADFENFQQIKDYCIQADSIGELAVRIGLDSVTLEKTVASYNNYAESNADKEFGRNALAGSTGKPVMIDSPPYYAFKARPALFGSYAGLKVDVQAHVLDVYDVPIPGFFAAGEVVGGFHGRHYHTGSAIAKSVIFGRIAGKTSAEEAKGMS